MKRGVSSPVIMNSCSDISRFTRSRSDKSDDSDYPAPAIYQLTSDIYRRLHNLICRESQRRLLFDHHSLPSVPRSMPFLERASSFLKRRQSLLNGSHFIQRKTISVQKGGASIQNKPTSLLNREASILTNRASIQKRTASIQT